MKQILAIAQGDGQSQQDSETVKMCASIVKSITHINPAFVPDILGFAIGILETACQ